MQKRGILCLRYITTNVKLRGDSILSQKKKLKKLHRRSIREARRVEKVTENES
jgi:hypothetical protein